MLKIRDIVEIILLAIREMHKILSNYQDFAELEKNLYQLTQKTMLLLTEAALRHIDERLMQSRDTKRLKLIHTKERTIITPFGEIELKRRYYKDQNTGQGRYLLDEALGIKPRQRISPWLTEIAVSMATEMPYHRAAALLKQLTLGAADIRSMSIWEEAQRAGKKLAERTEQERLAIFEKGEIPSAQRKSPSLCIEADEILISARTEKTHEKPKKKIPIKISVGYEGKASKGLHRKSLIERRVLAGIAEAQTFWEQTAAQFGRHWDLSAIENCCIGGDGAQWIKLGCEYFPRSTYRLDPYHLRRAILEGLGYNEKAYKAVCAALADNDWDRTEQALTAAKKTSVGARRKRIAELHRYLQANWEGICRSGATESLGAIEGQIFHHIARRMKRHGARWSRPGADHLARLLAARANGELLEAAKSVWQAQPEIIRGAVSGGPICDKDRAIRAIKEDPGAWLQKSMPALYGSSARDPWVKYVLRVLTQTLPSVV